MSVLTHNTTLPEAVTIYQQGRIGKDDLLGWLEKTYVGLSKLYLLLPAGLSSEEYALVSEAQSELQVKAEALAKASAAIMDSNKPYAKKKTACTLTREDFARHAEALEVSIGESTIEATVKESFSSGSFGWNINGKMEVMVNGERVKVQVSGNLIVVGSKDA